MASKVQSLLVFMCLHAVEGFRMLKQHKANACPGHVLVNTKGDCVNAVSQELAEGCCKQCIETIQGAKVSYDKQIAAYMGKCKLTPADVGPAGQPNHVVNPDKICSEECQAMTMEEALLEFAFSEVEEACATMPQELVPVQPVAKLLESFQFAWMECRKAPETTTAEPETTTTELETTTEPAMRFPPVQIAGPRDWRLLRDSSSLSAGGIGVDKNELSISVVPPGIPLDQIGGWQYGSTGHDAVLHVKHAVFGGTAMKLEVQGEMQYGSYQGAGQFLKDVRLKVVSTSVFALHVVTAHVKAVEAMSHGSATNPLASVALILEVEAQGRIFFKIQSWKRTMKYIFWGNGNIQSFFM